MKADQLQCRNTIFLTGNVWRTNLSINSSRCIIVFTSSRRKFLRTIFQLHSEMAKATRVPRKVASCRTCCSQKFERNRTSRNRNTLRFPCDKFSKHKKMMRGLSSKTKNMNKFPLLVYCNWNFSTPSCHHVQRICVCNLRWNLLVLDCYYWQSPLYKIKYLYGSIVSHTHMRVN